MEKGIYQEFGIGGVVFILVTLICLFIFNWSGIVSLSVGAIIALIIYILKKGLGSGGI